jgi:hypothetical protein
MLNQKTIMVDFDEIQTQQIHLEDSTYGIIVPLCRTTTNKAKFCVCTKMRNKVTCKFCLKMMIGRKINRI